MVAEPGGGADAEAAAVEIDQDWRLLWWWGVGEKDSSGYGF